MLSAGGCVIELRELESLGLGHLRDGVFEQRASLTGASPQIVVNCGVGGIPVFALGAVVLECAQAQDQVGEVVGAFAANARRRVRDVRTRFPREAWRGNVVFVTASPLAVRLELCHAKDFGVGGWG